MLPPVTSLALDPIDVGAPLPAPAVPELKAVPRGEGGSSLKIKVSLESKSFPGDFEETSRAVPSC